MQNELNPTNDRCQTEIYQIRIRGQLGCEWAEWFAGMTITLVEDGDTLLTGPVIDQSALYGLLKKVRDSGMSLVSVNPFKPNAGSVPDTKSENST